MSTKHYTNISVVRPQTVWVLKVIRLKVKGIEDSFQLSILKSFACVIDGSALLCITG